MSYKKVITFFFVVLGLIVSPHAFASYTYSRTPSASSLTLDSAVYPYAMATGSVSFSVDDPADIGMDPSAVIVAPVFTIGFPSPMNGAAFSLPTCVAFGSTTTDIFAYMPTSDVSVDWQGWADSGDCGNEATALGGDHIEDFAVSMVGSSTASSSSGAQTYVIMGGNDMNYETVCSAVATGTHCVSLASTTPFTINVILDSIAIFVLAAALAFFLVKLFVR